MKNISKVFIILFVYVIMSASANAEGGRKICSNEIIRGEIDGHTLNADVRGESYGAVKIRAQRGELGVSAKGISDFGRKVALSGNTKIYSVIYDDKAFILSGDTPQLTILQDENKLNLDNVATYVFWHPRERIVLVAYVDERIGDTRIMYKEGECAK